MRFPLFDGRMLSQGTINQAISSSSTKSAGVYRVQKTGNIRYIGTSYSALSGSPHVDLRLETVSGRLPTGTLWGTNTNVDYAPAGTNSFVWSQLTADGAVTAGDLVAAAVIYVSGTSATVQVRPSTIVASQGFPYACNATAGTYSAIAGFPCICLKYDDGTIVGGGTPTNSHTPTGYQSGTNPNERATVFTPLFACTLVGAWIFCSPASGAAFSVNLYAGTSTTATATAAVAADQNQSAGGGPWPMYVEFASAVSLTAGTAYRVSLLATAAANLTIGKMTFPSTAEMATHFPGISSDTRNGGAWIGESTTVVESIVPVIEVTSAAGGGIITAPSMAGCPE